jgi:hypothetical protein
VISGTANPDFSQVEADAFQLEANTRFALFYEEKRPFFLEGMEHFQMRLDPVYTRTIADPKWGLKLTGKEGSNSLGAFVVQDEITNFIVPGSQGSSLLSVDQPVTDAAVRYRMDLASASSAGIVLTARDGAGYGNLVGGADANLKLTPSDVVGLQVLRARSEYSDGFAAQTGLAAGELDGMAYDFEYNHDGGTFDWWAAYREIGDEFRADMGFRPRSDYRQTRGGWSYLRRAEAGHWYTALNSGFGYVHNEELSGSMLESYFDFWLNYEGPMRSELNVYGMVGREASGGQEFETRSIDANAAFWPNGSMLARLTTAFGRKIDYANSRQGDLLNLEPMLYLNVSRRLNVILSHEYEHMTVDEGRLYTANVSYARAAYQFTRRMFLRAIMSYADYDYSAELYSDGRSTRESYLATQVLFSYKLNPQTVLYLGYSDAHEGTNQYELAQKERTFFAKIGYALVL